MYIYSATGLWVCTQRNFARKSRHILHITKGNMLLENVTKCKYPVTNIDTVAGFGKNSSWSDRVDTFNSLALTLPVGDSGFLFCIFI